VGEEVEETGGIWGMLRERSRHGGGGEEKRGEGEGRGVLVGYNWREGRWVRVSGE